MTTIADYPALGFDPTPGDVDTVVDLYQRMRGVADTIAHVYEVLTGARPDRWRGKAADAFRANINNELAPALEKAHESFTDAASALDGWQRDMAEFQTRSARLERQAADAQAAVQRARWALDSLPPPPRDASVDDPHAYDRARLTSQLSNEQAALAELRRQAHAHHDDYLAAGTRYAIEFHDAEKIAPHKPGWLSSLVNSIEHGLADIGHLVSTIADDVGDLIGDIAANFETLLAQISDVLRLISGITALLALIPPLTAIMLPISIATGAAAMVGHATLKLCYGDGSWLNVGMDALGVVAGTGSVRLLGKIATAAKDIKETRAVATLAKDASGTADTATNAAKATRTGTTFNTTAQEGGEVLQANETAAEGAQSASRGLSKYGGSFSAEENEAGGTLWTSSGDIAQTDFASIGNSGLMKEDEVNIISGVHGTAEGETIVDKSLYLADMRAFGHLPNVSVHNLPDLGAEDVKALLSSKGTIIGAFCNSGVCLAAFK